MTAITRVLRSIRVRPRLATATVIGLGVLFLLPLTIAGPTRALAAWDVGVGLYLALAWTMMARGSVEKMRWRAQRQDDGALVVLTLTVIASVASLAAIVLELIGIKDQPSTVQTSHIALAMGTILCSWCLVHTAFALHYAHEFYGDDRAPARACLEFPGSAQPDYLDFLYFSFVIGTTSQTADVSITSSHMRRFALAHGVIAFFFNTTLLALTVNIAAGLI
jgi:uncharacterized membrane protein